MNRSLRNLAAVMVLPFLAGMLAVSGCGIQNSPILVSIAFSEAPALGKPVGVAAAFGLTRAHIKDTESDVTAGIFLPEGFELVEGTLQWQGEIVRGRLYSITAIVKPVKAGNWRVEAAALYSTGKGLLDGGSTTIFVSIDDNGAASGIPPAGAPDVFQAEPPFGRWGPLWPVGLDPVFRRIRD